MAKKLGPSRQRLVQTLGRYSQRQPAAPPIAAAPLPPSLGRVPHSLWFKLRLAALAALLVSIGACVFITRYSLVPISLAGISLPTHATASQLEQQLNNTLNDYRITVEYADGSTKAFSLAEAGITVDVNQSVKNALAIKNPDNLFKRIRWWGDTDVPLSLKADNASLESFVQNQATQVLTAAKDATISIDKGTVAIAPDQTGEAYTLSSAPQAIESSVRHLGQAPLKLTQQKLPAAITQQDLEPVTQSIKELLAQQVTLTINGQQVKAQPADIGNWIELTPSPPNHTVDYTVNSGKVLSYMNTVARRYIQSPVTQIVMPAPGGGMTVLVPGRNGVDITNKDSMAADIAKQVLDKKPVNVTLPVQHANFTTITAQPQDKWIVVDTTTKRMYAYEQSNLVRTFLVSAGAPQTPTVLGEYKIYSKHAVQDMRGGNADGSRYFQPAVKWVNYFYRDYAIHGNYWRPASYFGNINSSHGCVGIPDSEAQWLYNWAPIGTTVIVHK